VERNRVLVPLTCVECGELTVPVIRRFLEPAKTELILLHISETPKEAAAVHRMERDAHESEREYESVSTGVLPAATPGGGRSGHRLHGEGQKPWTEAAQLTESKRQEILAEYREILEGLREAGYSASMNIWFGSDTAHQILKAAEGEDVDLIAMATHGRSGVARLFEGSVAESVVRGGLTPVLLARFEV